LEEANMKNIAIEATVNGTYVVRADTERFGEHEIMFESYSKSECVQYILKTVAFLFRATDKELYLAEMIDWMGEDKRSKLTAACERNAYLTSYYGLEHIRTYESENGGVYIKMTRTPSRGQRKDIKFFRLAAHGCQLLLCRKA